MKTGTPDPILVAQQNSSYYTVYVQLCILFLLI